MIDRTETRACPGVGKHLRLPGLNEDENSPPKEHGWCSLCGAVVRYAPEKLFVAAYHEVPVDRFDCWKCGDSGKLSYTEEHLPQRIGTAEDGDAIVMEGTTHGTRACPCVKDLPPIEDDATWWESETVHHEVFVSSFATTVLGDTVEITVTSEVPRNHAGRRCVMRGNRYYPTMMRVEGEAGELHGGDAREFAAALLRAADKVDEIDGPCEDFCGHWFPCDCVADAVGKALAPYVGIPCLTRDERLRLMGDPF